MANAQTTGNSQSSTTKPATTGNGSGELETDLRQGTPGGFHWHLLAGIADRNRRGTAAPKGRKPAQDWEQAMAAG